jgi:hypothetical protein
LKNPLTRKYEVRAREHDSQEDIDDGGLPYSKFLFRGNAYRKCRRLNDVRQEMGEFSWSFYVYDLRNDA